MKDIKYLRLVSIIPVFVVLQLMAIADELPQLPEGWNNCGKADDCVVILGPCDTARAANRTHEEAVRKQTDTLALITSCMAFVEATSKEDDFVVSCRGGKCMVERKIRQVQERAKKTSARLKSRVKRSSSSQ